MSNVILFRTEEALFQFDRMSVMECLEHKKSSYGVQELDTLIHLILSQNETATLSLGEHQYFGFVALDLISAGLGFVTCKNCGKQQYRFNEIKEFSVEPDEATFKGATAKKGGFKNLFRKKPKPIGLSGGKGYKCPEGHVLIYMQTWTS